MFIKWIFIFYNKAIKYINNSMENFCKTYNISRETYSRLELYRQSLLEWQQKFNLVSSASLSDAWNRHFADSAQIFDLIPANAKTLLDMGSGAGFPGMVLAIMAEEKTPYLKVTLAESIAKKTLYLNHVKEVTAANVKILNTRVENIKGRFDVITARAVTGLSDLLKYASLLLSHGGICIFPKGKTAEEEIASAKTKWSFDFVSVPSKTSDEGQILIIRNLVEKRRK